MRNMNGIVVRTRLCVLIIFLASSLLSADDRVHRNYVELEQRTGVEYVWGQSIENPGYDLLFISCNMQPVTENDIQLKTRWKIGTTWSEWLDIAYWGKKSGIFLNDDAFRTYGLLTPPAVSGRSEVEVKIIASKPGDLAGLHSLYITQALSSAQLDKEVTGKQVTVELSTVTGVSQLLLKHPRAKDLCVPTTVTIGMNSFVGVPVQDPVVFADLVHDYKRDIYGNWFLNAHGVYKSTSGLLESYMTRLASFAALHHYLQAGVPVIVSVVGPLAGAAGEYTSGHWMIVIGWDAETREVICHDVAFPEGATLVRYKLNDFMDAWQRRQGAACIIIPAYKK